MSGLEARAGAVDVLRRVGKGRYLDRSVDIVLAARGALDPRDRSLLTAIAYQAVRHHRRIDRRIERAAKRKMGKIDEELRDVLRVGAVQLLCFDAVPAHAAVDTSVELAARTGRSWAKGFVNAVLREIARGGWELAEGDDPIAALGERESFPDWLVRRWVDEFGLGRATAFAARMNETAPLVLRPAPGEDVAGLIGEIRAQGFDVQPSPWIDNAIRVPAARPASLPGWGSARYHVQDEASQAIGLLLGSLGAGTVLDVCAGRGTKAVQLTERCDPRTRLVALDLSLQRLRELERVPIPAGRSRPQIVHADAAGALPFPDRSVGRILVDAPCTGFGTMRRHPEIKWRRGPRNIARQAEVQTAILAEAARVLAPGGTVVYATCTVTREENEGVVEAVRARVPELERVSCRERLPDSLRPCVGADGYFRSYPDLDSIDAFFAAVLERRAV